MNRGTAGTIFESEKEIRSLHCSRTVLQSHEVGT